MSKMKWKAESTENPLLSNKILWGCALDAFSSQSYREASLNEIIKCASMNKGSFYYRFYDKMDLYLSLLTCMVYEKFALFKEYDFQNNSNDFFVSLYDKAMLSLLLSKKEQRYNAMWRRIKAEDSTVRSYINEEFGDISQDVLLDIVEKAKADNQIKSDASSVFIARLLLSLLEGIDKMILPTSTDEEIIKELEQLIEILRKGI